MANIGNLTEVNVRNLWKHEQYDFSFWLSKEENLEYLNDILGLTLSEVKTEVYVGPYRCDLVAKDETSEVVVVIENQLESTNHEHLGKNITYVAGLDAKVIVWIVTEAKEEHQAAIEWLNNNTDSGINFFLIELQAYRIGNSDPAPYFKVVEQPNDFVKRSKSKDTGKEFTKTDSKRFAFWEQFNQILVAREKPFTPRKANHWFDIALGTSKACISIFPINKKRIVIIQTTINDDKELFDHLHKRKTEIEQELGFELIWARMDKRKWSGSNIICPV